MTASHCLLALFGHDLGTATPHARAGAMIVADALQMHTEVLQGLVEGLSKMKR